MPCESFPYAYRQMFNAVRRGVEKGGNTFEALTQSMCIVSPQKDQHNEFRRYTYAAATTMAIGMGVVSSDGQLNGKEFKRR